MRLVLLEPNCNHFTSFLTFS